MTGQKPEPNKPSLALQRVLAAAKRGEKKKQTNETVNKIKDRKILKNMSAIWEKRRSLIVLWVGGLLIILRLFFPVEERAVYRKGAKIIVNNPKISKRVNVAKTGFHCIGIGVLTGLFFISSKQLKKEQKQK